MGSPLEIIRADAVQIARRVDLSPLTKKSVLITGASGLIGSYLLACLERVPLAKVTVLYHSSEVLFCQDRVVGLRRGVPRRDGPRKYDYIIHAAGYGQPHLFMQNQFSTIDVNTTLLLEIANFLHPRGRLLYLSSSEIYSGNPYKCGERAIGRTTPQHPRSAYIEGKRCGEAIVSALRAAGKVAIAARIALAYGPGAKIGDTRAINQFIQRGLTMGEVQLWDSGLAQRAYCYIADTICMLWSILLYGKDDVYNVGNPQTTTIAALARQIGKELNVPVSIPEEGVGDFSAPAIVSLSIQRYLDEFGPFRFWRFDAGIQRTIEWYTRLFAEADKGV